MINDFFVLFCFYHSRQYLESEGGYCFCEEKKNIIPVTFKSWAAALVVQRTKACFRENWILNIFQTVKSSALTQLSGYEEQGQDVKPARDVTMLRHSNIKISCSRHCWSSHLTIRAIAHSNDSPRNKPSHHNFDWPTLRYMTCFFAACWVQRSSWAALLTL